MENLIEREGNIKIPFSQQLWLQIEDEHQRNQIHYDMLSLYALSLEDEKEAAALVQDFIEGMEVLGETELKNKAERLLISISELKN